ncbi:feruloyl esterase A precursor [Pleurostoma richardsiae]|uniref:Feruloyl esterase A n=1 Tax=Pleurostoma richardsiae TaxID=41990 RepID=A0AA38VCB2_9PEZI|nr:feruloyl esterase A precursor [Pleurostoma richardsiae]
MHFPIMGLAILLSSLTAAQKTAVDSAVLADLYRYAAFSSAAYSSNCTVPPFGTAVEQYINDAGTDTQATLFRDDQAGEFILAFRGTSTVQDFLTDLDQDLVACSAKGISCMGCTCSRGYLRQYMAVQDSVAAAIDTGMGSHLGYSIVVTGHSMGGALASIGAASLKGQGASLVAYTYGQPRTGNTVYADYIDSQFPAASNATTMTRVTHANDGVPQIPSQDDGYRHHTTEFWQSEDPASVDDTFMCTGQEPQDCNQSEIGIGIGNGGRGINAAHLRYLGISIGNPLDPDAACRGTV